MNELLEEKLNRLSRANLNVREKSFVSNIEALILNGFELTGLQNKTLDVMVARKAK